MWQLGEMVENWGVAVLFLSRATKLCIFKQDVRKCSGGEFLPQNWEHFVTVGTVLIRVCANDAKSFWEIF